MTISITERKRGIKHKTGLHSYHETTNARASLLKEEGELEKMFSSWRWFMNIIALSNGRLP